VHLGNYSLWLAGLFPDYIAARRSRKGGPDLPYYDELGRQDFASRRSTGSPSTSASPPSTAPPPSGSLPCA